MVDIFLGNGDGTLRGPTGFSFPTVLTPIRMIAADFNRDGKLDLTVGTAAGVSILLGNGDGTFQPHVDYQVGTAEASSLVAGDFNGDGELDLAYADEVSSSLNVLLGNGDGTFQSSSAVSTACPFRAMTAADLNGDGSPDLIGTSMRINALCVLLGNGDGTFRAGVRYSAGTAP